MDGWVDHRIVRGTRQELRAMHDLLVEALTAANRPHPEQACWFCTHKDDLEDAVADKTYSEDELQAAVQRAADAAVATLRTEKDAEIATLKASQAEAAIEARIATATEELAAKVAQLETDLEAKTLEASAEKAAREAAETAAAEKEREAAEAAEKAALKDARVTSVREVAKSLDDIDEIVAKGADRWAEMTEEAFESALDLFKAATKNAPPPSRKVPKTSVMTAAEEGTGKPARSSGGSAVRALRDRKYAPAAG